MWMSNWAASRTRRSGIDRPNSCFHQACCERPTMMWPTLCERANSRMASTGSLALEAHGLGAQLFGLLDVGEQVALQFGVDLHSGDSSGVSTKTTNQSVLNRPAMREPRRTNMGVRGDPEDTHTMTRLRVAEACRPAAIAEHRSCYGGGAFDAFGHLAQGQLAQVGQVLLFEEVLQRPRDAIGLVDLAGAQAFLQIFDGEIEVDHLIGLLEKAVGDGFAHHHAR
jgi:hypothetical protein